MPSDSSDQKLAGAQTATFFVGATPPPPPQQSENLPCPRCDSTNTKFCYYNNYNLSQPRHFCKSCRRYWTQGGTLRNVPIGGGTRKNSKRSRAANNISSSSCSTVTNTNNSNIDTGVIRVSESESLEANGSFTTLLSSHGHGFLGFEDMGFGVAEKSTSLWPYQEVKDSHGYSGGGGGGSAGDDNVWQMSGVEHGSLLDGDCFAWPDLAISTTRNGFK